MSDVRPAVRCAVDVQRGMAERNAVCLRFCPEATKIWIEAGSN